MKQTLKTDRQATGQTGEFLVASELARRGYSVALPSGNAKDYDLLAYKDGKTRVVQVKCVSKGAFQLNLGKYFEIEISGKTQKIIGPKRDFDSEIDFIIVFLKSHKECLGGYCGRDTFFCMKLGEFIELIRSSHQDMLDKHGGMRSAKPKNYESLHSGFTRRQLEERGLFSNMTEWFRD